MGTRKGTYRGERWALGALRDPMGTHAGGIETVWGATGAPWVPRGVFMFPYASSWVDGSGADGVGSGAWVPMGIPRVPHAPPWVL